MLTDIFIPVLTAVRGSVTTELLTETLPSLMIFCKYAREEPEIFRARKASSLPPLSGASTVNSSVLFVIIFPLIENNQTAAGKEEQHTYPLSRGKFGIKDIVAAQSFVEKAQNAVYCNVNAGGHAAFDFTQQPAEEDAEEEVFSGFEELDGVDGQGACGFFENAVCRSFDSPPQGRCSAETAAVEETSDTAESVRRRQSRNKDIQYPDKVQLFDLTVNDQTQQCKQKTAVKDQTSLIDADNAPQVVFVLVKKLHDIEDAGTEDAGYHRQKEQR